MSSDAGNQGGKGLRLSGAALVVSNLAIAGSQWVLLWFYAVLGGAAVVGEYSLAIALTTPIFIILDLSLRNVYVTNQREAPFASYLVIRLFTCLAATLILVIIAAFGILNVWLLLFIGLSRSSQAVLDLAFGDLQKNFRIGKIAVASLLNSAVTIVFGAGIYYLTKSVELSLLGIFVGGALTSLVVIIPILKSGGAAASGKEVWHRHAGHIIRKGLPSGLAYGSVSLLTYLPIYFLGAHSSQSDVGLFTALAYFMTFANIFYNSVQQVTIGSYVAAYKADGMSGLSRYARRLSIPMMGVGLLSGGLLVAIGAPAMELVYGTAFVPPFPVLVPMAAALVLLPVLYLAGGVMLTLNKYDSQLVIGVISLAVTCGIALLLGRDFGLFEASMIVLAGTTVRAILGAVVSVRALKKASSQ